MGVVALVAPQTLALTTYAAVKDALNLDYEDAQAFLTSMIARVSAGIVGYTQRNWARGTYRETLPPSRSMRWHLRYVPVLALAATVVAGQQAETYTRAEDLSGSIWLGTGLYGPGSYGASAYAGYAYGYAYGGGAYWRSVDYTAGYLLPGDDRAALVTVSVNGPTNTFHTTALANDLLHNFPLLTAGDLVTTSGFASAANNGLFTVVSSTRTDLVVSGGTLVTAAAGASIALAVSTLPNDIQEACVNSVSAAYLNRQFSLSGPRVMDTGAGTLVLNSPPGFLTKASKELLQPYRQHQRLS